MITPDMIQNAMEAQGFKDVGITIGDVAISLHDRATGYLLSIMLSDNSVQRTQDGKEYRHSLEEWEGFNQHARERRGIYNRHYRERFCNAIRSIITMIDSPEDGLKEQLRISREAHAYNEDRIKRLEKEIEEAGIRADREELYQLTQKIKGMISIKDHQAAIDSLESVHVKLRKDYDDLKESKSKYPKLLSRAEKKIKRRDLVIKCLRRDLSDKDKSTPDPKLEKQLEECRSRLSESSDLLDKSISLVDHERELAEWEKAFESLSDKSKRQGKKIVKLAEDRDLYRKWFEFEYNRNEELKGRE